MRYVGKLNVFFTTSLDLSFDGTVPTFLNLSPGWVEIEGYLLLGVFFSENYMILSNYNMCVLMEHQCAVKY